MLLLKMIKVMKINYPKLKKNNGFSLLEALIAISIFVMSVVALIMILSGSLSDITFAKRKIEVAYLVQEGVEYVRNMRDDFVLFGTSVNPWDDFVNKLDTAGCFNLIDGCYFDPERNSSGSAVQLFENNVNIRDMWMSACSGDCPSLLYRSIGAVNIYGYVAGVDTQIRRKITAQVINPNEIKITSHAVWRHKSGFYNLSFSQSLFNWASK